MFRRMLIAISFVAALGVAGFVATESAYAGGRHHGGHGHGHHHGHGHGHRGHYGAYYGGGYGYGRGYGYYPHVIRSSYYPATYYGGPVYYGGGYGGASR